MTSDDLQFFRDWNNVVHIHQVSLKSDQLWKIAQFDLRWPQNDLHFFQDQMQSPSTEFQ